MRSEYVRREWEYALALRREGFIRPTYWEDPMPQDGDLPPRALLKLQFAQLPLGLVEARPVAAPPVAAPAPAPGVPGANAARETPARIHAAPRVWRALAAPVAALALVGGLAAGVVILNRSGPEPADLRAARAEPPQGISAGSSNSQSLARAYRSLGGTSVDYPAAWAADRVERRRSGRTVDFERLDVAEEPISFAPARVQLVFGSPEDFALPAVGNLNALLAKANRSLRNHTHGATLRFDAPHAVTLDGAPAVVRAVDWSVSPSIGGGGLTFATRNASTRTWVYGWALYETSDTDVLGAADRRQAVFRVVDSIRW
jgi:hypothetical protein